MNFRPIVNELKEKVAGYKEITENYALLKAEANSIFAHSLVRIEKINTDRKQLQSRYAELEAKIHALEAKLKSL